MANRQSVNPLLFSANSSSAFDNLSAPAVLVPPSQNEPQNVSNDVEETDCFLGQSSSEDKVPRTASGISASHDVTVQGIGVSGIGPGPPPHRYVTPGSSTQPFSLGPPSLASSSNPSPSASPRLPHTPGLVPSGFIGSAPPVSRPTSLDPPLGPLPLGPPPSGPPPTSLVPGAPLSSIAPPLAPPPSSTPLGSFPSSISPAPSSLIAPPPTGFSPNIHSANGNDQKEEIPLSSVNLGPQPSHMSAQNLTGTEATTQATVIPASFENMANNPPSQDGMYHPVIYHWFYAVGQPPVWKPFSFTDSLALEDAYRTGNTDIIATDGGRHDVSIGERLRRAVYWDETEPSPVRRCSWFKKGALEAQPTPYEENVAEKLEEAYRDAVMSGRWHKQVDLKEGDRIMIHSTRVMLHYQGVEGEFPTGISVNGSQTPLTVKRGTEDFDIADGDAEQVDHLLFLVHGIGSVCDLRFRPVEQCVDDFRKLGQQLLATHFKQSVDMGLIGRVEILPVSWHKALHGDATGIDEKLKPITLRSIPKLREFTNDTILDVLLFTSPIYCQHIIDTVASELNRLHKLFCERNPSFSGPVSLGGHSLGSVILFDLLMHQSPEAAKSSETEPLPSADAHSICARDRTDSVTSPVNYVMGGLGTGQPSITYPQITFKPDALFLMGSPIGMFITVRGIDTIGTDFELPSCKRVFNIFHPFDPVAYRLETLIDPTLTDLRPVLIPHHKGRKRMHLELKETIERVGSEFKQKIVDSIQGTWNRLYEFYRGSSTSTAASLEKEVDEALNEKLFLADEESQQGASGELKIPVGRLNQGRRIDYVLQEKPYESFNEYIFALQAHVTYWESEDTMLLILKELYGPQGISCDNEHLHPGQQTLHCDGDSALGSGSVTPTSPPMFDAASMTLSYASSHTTAPSPAPSEPIPLFTSPPTNTSTSGAGIDPGTGILSHPNPSTLPVNQMYQSPRIIGGRPVMNPDSKTMGMDPTARPTDKPPVGPPPKMQVGSFVRASPFRR